MRLNKRVTYNNINFIIIVIIIIIIIVIIIIIAVIINAHVLVMLTAVYILNRCNLKIQFIISFTHGL